MKTILLTILAAFFTTNAFTQEIKISISPTMNNALHLRYVSGGPNYNWRPGVNASLSYHFKTDNKINFAVGLTYQNATVQVDPFITPQDDPPPFNESINLLALNVGAYYNFNKGYFASIDPLIHFQIDYHDDNSISNQTGIGISGGIGKKLNFKSNMSISIEPKIWIYNLIPFQEESLPLRLTVAGLNIGLNFK